MEENNEVLEEQVQEQVQEEVQTTFNTDGLEVLVEEGSVENASENE